MHRLACTTLEAGCYTRKGCRGFGPEPANMLTTTSPGSEGFTDEEKAAATEQLERLLANPFFSHSRRFPAFLRYIVEQTLAGQADQLKERTLGVEVFHKPADYDTSSDPIVRVTAAEIRKRIALYYQEPGHEEELRIILPAGSYVPQFQRPQEAHRAVPSGSESLPENPAYPPVESAFTEKRHPRKRLVFAGLVAGILLCGIGFTVWKIMTRSPVHEFWDPVLDSSNPALFCIADQTQYTAITLRDAADPSIEHTMRDNLTAVVIDDLWPLVKFAGVMQSAGKKYSVQGEGSTTLTNLRNGPDVLIGAYDNAWTLRLLRPLRFHFANNADMTEFSIVDAESKKPTQWAVSRPQQEATNIYRDYAIVARFTDTMTGQVTIVAAGIARGGTIVAGEFLTDPDLLRQIEHLPGYSSSKNIELVLSTQIIGGQPGTPHIEASYIW